MREGGRETNSNENKPRLRVSELPFKITTVPLKNMK
jgi:hypothetical protein